MLEYSFFKKNLFFFACAGSSLLHRLFSSFSEWELLCVAVFGLLIAEASLVAEHGLSYSATCGIFLDQGLNL